MTYADKLRQLADYMDTHPEIAEKVGTFDYPSVSLWATDWDEFQALASTLGGYDKGGYGGTLSATHRPMTDDYDTIFRCAINVGGVCEQKPKLDESGQPVMRRKSTYVETDEMEPETEWECPKVWTK